MWKHLCLSISLVNFLLNDVSQLINFLSQLYAHMLAPTHWPSMHAQVMCNQARIWRRHYWRGTNRCGLDGILGPTKHLLISKLFFSKKPRRNVQLLKSNHHRALVTRKNGFFSLFFLISFMSVVIFFSGYWALKDPWPDNLGGCASRAPVCNQIKLIIKRLPIS